jgi:hypothetical protein
MSRDWTPFTQNLVLVLSRLEEDQFLIISAKNNNRYLQFSCQGAWGMRAEVTSNHFLKGESRLTRHQMAWLRSHGWSAPTGKPKESMPDRDPDGSPNYYIDFPESVPESEIAHLAIDTLANGLAFPYPGALVYESFDANGEVLVFQELGLKPLIRQESRLMDMVLAVFRSVTGITDLELDEDGDVSVRYGSILVSALQLDNRVRLFSALMADVAETPTLLRKLNQINDGAHRIRCFLHGETVYASLDVSASPFVPEHLTAGIGEFTEVAEGLAIVLRAEFSGNTLLQPSGPVTSLQ